MATAVAQHTSKVIAHVDGLAASAATHVALAAAEVEIAAAAFFMIHNGWAFAIGGKEDMLQMAELLEKVDHQIAADYVRQTGNSLEQVVEWMDAETWFTADESIEHGFADRLAPETAEALAVASATPWDLSAYEHAPRAPEPAQLPNGGGPSPAEAAEKVREIEAQQAVASRARQRSDNRLKLAERTAN